MESLGESSKVVNSTFGLAVFAFSRLADTSKVLTEPTIGSKFLIVVLEVKKTGWGVEKWEVETDSGVDNWNGWILSALISRTEGDDVVYILAPCSLNIGLKPLLFAPSSKVTLLWS